ncbi:MAG TPA: hypothetical protein VNZ44_16255 [Pyrinomonadaceae bacterium]|nr:hypothetical protein [Pyrinomonadaceae bacterium]
MAWQNAPALNKLTAAQHGGGKYGAQLWGVDHRGRLYTNYQMRPEGGWDGWLTNSWSTPGYPDPVYELCASQQYYGRIQLWVLDMKRQLWTIQQGTPGGDWLGWSGPGWNNLPKGTVLKKMAAVQLPDGGQFWGITEEGKLITTSQVLPAGNWRPWQDVPETPKDLSKNPPVLPAQWVEVTACTEGDLGSLWAIDTRQQLWHMSQQKKGGPWGPWQGPNWKNAPKLRNVAAVQMGPPVGACVWGITDEYKVVQNTQSRAGLDDWWGWSVGSFKDELRGYEITAARQSDRSARVWVISNGGVLVSQEQNPQMSPPLWDAYWTPELTPDQ